MALSLRTILRFPAFLFGTLSLFYMFSLGSLLGFVRWWDLTSPRRNDVHASVHCLTCLFRVKILKLGTQEVHQGRCMYLCNHRSWGDFFTDMYITGCRGVPMSRRAVGIGFPAFTTSLVALKAVLLFNRAGVRDKEKFNAWIDKELAKGGHSSLLVYPEGKRNQTPVSLPLKHGMLRYAYTRGMPVQAVITAGKEEVLNEKLGWLHFGRTLVTGCSEVLEPSRFGDFEGYMAAVQALWDRQWAAIYSGPRQGLPELPEPVPAPGKYTPFQRAAESAALALWTAIMLGTAWGTLRALAALAAWSLVGRAVVASLVLWTAASLLGAALLPPPERRHKVAADISPSGAASEEEASAKAL